MGTPMGTKCGWAFRVKNPIQTQKYKFALAETIDVMIPKGTIGLFWDQQTDGGNWNVSIIPPHEGSDACGAFAIPNLGDIEFLSRKEWIAEFPNFGNPPENLL